MACSRSALIVMNLDMWDFLDAALQRHADEVDLVIAGGDQCYSDGVATLDIWQHLNRTMRKEDGRLLPDEEAMLSWYCDIYRGYWGFESVQRVFDSFPTYMIWDDHEIGDGWGSYYFRKKGKPYGLSRLLPAFEERGLTYEEWRELMRRMFHAAKQAYIEYEHSHNPPTPAGNFDYAFRRGGCAFYVLDGRGRRDIERKSYCILGQDQFKRFVDWVNTLTPEETPFLFVVSAVPMLHTRAVLVNADEQWLISQAGLDDDLRDSWEHDLHKTERAALMKVLFAAAAKGIKVAILSWRRPRFPRSSPSRTMRITASTSSRRVRSPITSPGRNPGSCASAQQTMERLKKATGLSDWRCTPYEVPTLSSALIRKKERLGSSYTASKS